MFDFEHHSHVSMDRLISTDAPLSPDCSSLVCAASSVNRSTDSIQLSNWNAIRRMVDRVHKHTRGHAEYSDMRTLLQRNKLWDLRV